MPTIDLPPEIVISNKTPRSAVAFDFNSGIRALPPRIVEVVILGQKIPTGTGVAGSPVRCYREADGELLGGAGSMADRMVRAALKAFPNAKLTLAVFDELGAGVVSTLAITLATNASSDGQGSVWIANDRVDFKVVNGDTPTIQAAAARDAILAGTNLAVTASAAAGVLTITSKGKGAIMNELYVRMKSTATGTTFNGGSSVAAFMTGGTGVAPLTTALAGIVTLTGEKKIPLGLNDSASATALRDQITSQADGEHNQAEIGVVATNGALSVATTLTGALNKERMVAFGVNSSFSWSPEIAAGCAAVLASTNRAGEPHPGLVVKGIAPPPVEKRWIWSESRNAYDNGVSPLKVNASEEVVLDRVITTRFKNAGGVPDYSILDVLIIQCLDRARQVIIDWNDRVYPRINWAEDDPDGLLPPFVKTPSQVNLEYLNLLEKLQEEGTLKNVSKYASEQLIEKSGTAMLFSLPADTIDAMFEKLGKLVFRRAA